MVLGAGDNFLLQSTGQVTEVIAIASHPHNEIAVLLRLSLCLAQGLGGYHVKLHVMAAHLEVAAHQVSPVRPALLTRDKAGGKLEIQERAAGPQDRKIVV